MLVRIYFIIPTVAYNVLLYFLHSCWDFTWDIYVQNSTAEKMGREKEQMWSHMEQGVTRRLPSTVQAGRTVFSRTHICVLVLRTLSTRATRKERMENLPAPHPPLLIITVFHSTWPWFPISGPDRMSYFPVLGLNVWKECVKKEGFILAPGRRRDVVHHSGRLSSMTPSVRMQREEYRCWACILPFLLCILSRTLPHGMDPSTLRVVLPSEIVHKHAWRCVS